MKNTLSAIFIGLALIIGFFIGRSTINTETDVKYVKGKTITDTAYIPIPYAVNIPSKIKFVNVYKKDSTGREISILDTTKSKEATIHDWNLERKYSNQVFNNENGKLLYDITVQNNKLSKFNYTFTPIQKVTTTIKERIFQPYVSGSYSTLDIASVGGGFFYHNLGIEYQLQKDFRYNGTGHSLGLKYKF